MVENQELEKQHDRGPMTTPTIINDAEERIANGNGSSEQQPLLQVQDLHVWYELKRFGFGHAGYVRAVDGVEFDLQQGEAIACVGESGCGKSSLMKAILGLNWPTKGDVIFDGTPLTQVQGNELREYRSKIGYVSRIHLVLCRPS
jgi:peptide/nickel transport system ATP-binding protein